MIRSLSLSKSSGKKALEKSDSGDGQSLPGSPLSSTSSSSASAATLNRRTLSISRKKDEAPGTTAKALPPLPPPEELEAMFMEIVMAMNVPDSEKAKMKAFPAEKKWQLVHDSDQAREILPPRHYLDLLEKHLRKRKKKKKQSSKEVAATEKDLRGMEISLRTNPLSWINEFIDPPNNGYEMLSEFLQAIPEDPNDADLDKERYLCLLCVKAVMNNKYGFNHVLKRPGSIKQLASCLAFPQEKANMLLFNLLAAVCVVGGAEGHRLTLEALEALKALAGEQRRFQTLIGRLSDERFHFEYKASCVAFINVLVHSPETMNFRIYLQYEFTLLGMDGLVDTLLSANSEILDVQLHGYLANFVTVPDNFQSRFYAKGPKSLRESSYSLAEDADTSVRQELEDKITALQKEMQEREQAAASRISELQKLIGNQEVDQLLKAVEALRLENQALRSGASPESLQQLASTAAASPPPGTTPSSAQTDAAQAGGSAAPPPPPPPSALGAPPPPPPPGMGSAPENALPPKKRIQPRVPLPTLNWMPIKDPKATVFAEIDDENFLKAFDFGKFEQRFKRNAQNYRKSVAIHATLDRKATKEEIQVVDANRSRNVLLAMKKIDMKHEDLAKAITELNTQKFRGDQADILLRCLPTQEEVANLRAHERNLDKLTEGDRFLFFLSTIDRLEAKLKILSFIDNFKDNLQNLEPQINSVVTAAGSIRASGKLKKIFEVVLAFGNYMNSAKRGGAYGFKLSALDRLTDVKSVDSPQTLLHFIAEIVSNDYPAYNSFSTDLLSLEAASAVSIQTATTEIQELANGLKLLEAELKYHKGNTSLENFYKNAAAQMEALQGNFNNMIELFQSLVVYFGEDPKTTESTEFFSCFLRFTRNYQNALKENELLAKEAAKAAAKAQNTTGKRIRGSYVAAEKGAVDDVINEIRLKGFRR